MGTVGPIESMVKQKLDERKEEILKAFEKNLDWACYYATRHIRESIQNEWRGQRYFTMNWHTKYETETEISTNSVTCTTTTWVEPYTPKGSTAQAWLDRHGGGPHGADEWVLHLKMDVGWMGLPDTVRNGVTFSWGGKRVPPLEEYTASNGQWDSFASDVEKKIRIKL
jgi:hypothetical protein